MQVVFQKAIMAIWGGPRPNARATDIIHPIGIHSRSKYWPHRDRNASEPFPLQRDFRPTLALRAGVNNHGGRYSQSRAMSAARKSQNFGVLSKNEGKMAGFRTKPAAVVTLTRSASEGVNAFPRWRFGLVSAITAGGIARAARRVRRRNHKILESLAKTWGKWPASERSLRRW